MECTLGNLFMRFTSNDQGVVLKETTNEGDSHQPNKSGDSNTSISEHVSV